MNYLRQSRNFHFEEDPFSEKAQSIAKTMYEALFSMKFLQTKPQIKKTNINYSDFFYTLVL